MLRRSLVSYSRSDLAKPQIKKHRLDSHPHVAACLWHATHGLPCNTLQNQGKSHNRLPKTLGACHRHAATCLRPYFYCFLTSTCKQKNPPAERCTSRRRICGLCRRCRLFISRQSSAPCCPGGQCRCRWRGCSCRYQPSGR